MPITDSSCKHESRGTVRSSVGRLALAAVVGIGTTWLTKPPQAQTAVVADGRPLVSILELMEKTITPATNTLWGAYEPPATDEEWAKLEEAAITLLAAANLTAIGGTGPMDAEWVKQPAWRAFNQVMTQAAADALKAIRARDHESFLVAANDVLYPPCEGCHMAFNPAVIAEGEQP